MIKFRTEIESITSKFDLNHQHQLFSVGSCFSQEIGQQLAYRKFKISINPYGTLFNPISIKNCIEWSLNEFNPLSDYTIENQHVFKNHFFHSDINALSKSELDSKLQALHASTKLHLRNTDVLFVTLGTAFVHELENCVVANCHKKSSSLFSKRLLDLEEIKAPLNLLAKLLPQVKHIIITVSPIRHTRETLPLNNVSKSLLLLAVHETVKSNAVFTYFPSYEIMMDDLRDYRFYKEDLIHPNKTAINYIFNCFEKAFLTRETQQLNKEIIKIQKAIDHNPFHSKTETHQKFLENTLSNAKKLHSEVNLTDLIDQLENRLA